MSTASRAVASTIKDLCYRIRYALDYSSKRMEGLTVDQAPVIVGVGHARAPRPDACQKYLDGFNENNYRQLDRSALLLTLGLSSVRSIQDGRDACRRAICRSRESSSSLVGCDRKKPSATGRTSASRS